MMPGSTGRRSVRFAGVALLAFTMLAPGCGRPKDSAWLQFLGFRESGKTTAIAVLDGDLNDETTDSVDAAFKNASLTIGTTTGSTGTGILVTSARIDYTLSGYSPPSAEYALNLYIPSSSAASGTVTYTEGTLTGLPLATTTLKNWLIGTHAFNDPDRTPAVNLTARVTFSAITDEGTSLEVSGSIKIVLDATGTSASSKTLNVEATTATASLSAPGVFTVSRTGSTTKALTVYYTVSGTATPSSATVTGDYEALDGYVAIAGGSADATINVTPISGFTDGETVIITLTANDNYTVGSLPKATVTLKD